MLEELNVDESWLLVHIKKRTLVAVLNVREDRNE